MSQNSGDQGSERNNSIWTMIKGGAIYISISKCYNRFSIGPYQCYQNFTAAKECVCVCGNLILQDQNKSCGLCWPHTCLEVKSLEEFIRYKCICVEVQERSGFCEFKWKRHVCSVHVRFLASCVKMFWLTIPSNSLADAFDKKRAIGMWDWQKYSSQATGTTYPVDSLCTSTTLF